VSINDDCDQICIRRDARGRGSAAAADRRLLGRRGDATGTHKARLLGLQDLRADAILLGDQLIAAVQNAKDVAAFDVAKGLRRAPASKEQARFDYGA
jgi:hypothetical protein